MSTILKSNQGRSESLAQRASKLVKVAKEKGIVKSHIEAFKEFPVEEENHKGNKDYYNK